MSYETEIRDGHVIAWIDDAGQCENKTCRQAIRKGLRVHITPAHTDPRASEVTLAMASNHYATRDEALSALDEAWLNAVEVSNASDRDAAYALKANVKVRHDGDYS